MRAKSFHSILPKLAMIPAFAGIALLSSTTFATTEPCEFQGFGAWNRCTLGGTKANLKAESAGFTVSIAPGYTASLRMNCTGGHGITQTWPVTAAVSNGQMLGQGSYYFVCNAGTAANTRCDAVPEGSAPNNCM